MTPSAGTEPAHDWGTTLQIVQHIVKIGVIAGLLSSCDWSIGSIGECGMGELYVTGYAECQSGKDHDTRYDYWIDLCDSELGSHYSNGYWSCVADGELGQGGGGAPGEDSGGGGGDAGYDDTGQIIETR